MTVSVSILPCGGLRFEGVGDPLLRVLRQMRDPVELSEEAVEKRLFPDPVENPHIESGLLEDWNGIVQPDLQDAFLSARETVAADLRGATCDEGGTWAFQIPAAHLDAWLNALTQARLALAEIHDFSEGEMGRAPSDLEDPREYALFQMGVYGMLLEWLLSISNQA